MLVHKHSNAILELKERGEIVSRFYILKDGKRVQKAIKSLGSGDLVVACRNDNVLTVEEQ